MQYFMVLYLNEQYEEDALQINYLLIIFCLNREI